MAQNRYWNWEDNDSTFRLNQRDYFVMPHGRYQGFDLATSTALWVLHLDQLQTGKLKVNLDLTNTPKLGMWKTKQGMVVEEDSEVTINITPLAPGLLSGGRIDLIVGEHDYEEITGGTVAIYKSITGTPSTTPVAPALTIPNKQTILGTLFIPYNATNLTSTGVIWTPAIVPSFADDPTIVHTIGDQIITGLKTIVQSKGVEVTATISGTSLVLPTVSNLYRLAEVDANVYKDIKDIVITSGVRPEYGWAFILRTDQKLVIKHNEGSAATNIYVSPVSQAVIEDGDTLTFLDLKGASYVSGTSPYILMKGGENKTNQRFKGKNFTGHSYGGSALFDETNKRITVNGNYVELTPSAANKELNFIGNPLSGHPNSDRGSFLVIQLQSFGLKLFNSISSAPAGFSKILLPPGGVSFDAPAGSMLFFMQTGAGWLLTNVVSDYYSILNIATRYDELNDVEVTGLATNDFPMWVGGIVNKWKNFNFKTTIQNTVIAMAKLFTGNVYVGDNTNLNGGVHADTTLVGIGMPVGSFANVIRIVMSSATTLRLGAMPAAYPVGTVVRIHFEGYPVNVVTGAESGYYDPAWEGLYTGHPIQDQGKVVTIPVGSVIELKKEVGYWSFNSDQWRAPALSTVLTASTASLTLTTPANLQFLTAVGLIVCKDSFGIVRFRGSRIKAYGLSGGSYTGTITTLPAGFRPNVELFTPDAEHQFCCPVHNSSTNESRMVIVRINGTTGVVNLFPLTMSGTPDPWLEDDDIIDLRGISFEAQI